MEVNVWSDVQINVESARGAALPISAITKANPAVASSVGHGLLDGDLILIICAGMLEANYLVARVDNKTADTVELEGVDSTGFHTFTSGNAYKLTFGKPASTFTDISWSGGESEDINIRTIHNAQDFTLPGNFSPLNASMGSLWLPDDDALKALRSFTKLKTPCGIEFVFSTGAKVYCAATPGFRLAPAGSAGGAVTTPGKLSLRGDLTTYAS